MSTVLQVGVARALYSSQPVLLLDDPFAALDAATARGLLRFLLEHVRRERRVALLSTHSLFLFTTDSEAGCEWGPGSMPDQEQVLNIILLQRGQVVATGPLAALQATSSPYFMSLVAANSGPPSPSALQEGQAGVLYSVRLG